MTQSSPVGVEVPQAVVLDGGFSSQLSCHVGDRVDGDPLWTARFLQTNPDEVIKTHGDFLRAGADAILTNTYQASIGGFVKYLNLTPEDSYKLIGTAVELAKTARAKFLEDNPGSHVPMIVGSVGPYGAHLHDGSEYSGAYADKTSKETMIEWHRPRMEALVKGGVDLLALETIPCEKEADALLQLLKEFPETKAWMSFSVKDDKCLSFGENFQFVIKKCWDTNPGQLVAIGVNCCDPNFIVSLFQGVNDDRKESPIPFVVYPNSGEKYNPELGGWTESDGCQRLENFIQTWLDLGVRYVGGCCRTYAEDIKRICTEVKIWNEKSKNATQNRT